jgi:hypothetical protein
MKKEGLLRFCNGKEFPSNILPVGNFLIDRKGFHRIISASILKGDYMRAKKGLFVALGVVALVAMTVTFLPAARNSTAECQRNCNFVEQDCKVECRDARDLCVDECQELTGDAQAACNDACNSVKLACDNQCAAAKEECKASCPRGGQESPYEPEP